MVEMPASEQVERLQSAKEASEAGRYDEAVNICFRVLEQAPNSPGALHILGYCYLMADKPVLAYQFYKRALAFRSDRAEIWNNFGRAADELHRYEEAEAAFKHAMTLEPSYQPAYTNLAVVLINQGRYPEAIKVAEEAVAMNPEQKNAWVNVGFASLALHDWKRGWEGYHKAIGSKYRYDVSYGSEPEWDGARVGTLVVTGEQGIGDELMFAQMIEDAARDVDTLVYDCHPRLEGIFRRSFAHIPNVLVFGTRKAQELEWLSDYRPDAHISLADLGMFYRDDAAKFPRKAFIQPDPERVLQWKALFESWGKPVIGVAWSGGNFNTQSIMRRIGLESFKSMVRDTDAVFVSLEYKDCEREIEESGLPIRWFPRATMAQDYDETAGMIAALDCVIGIHTSSLHMAASMGKRTIALVPSMPQWRYYKDDMPWYPDWHTFRRHGDEPWENVIDRARERALVPLLESCSS